MYLLEIYDNGYNIHFHVLLKCKIYDETLIFCIIKIVTSKGKHFLGHMKYCTPFLFAIHQIILFTVQFLRLYVCIARIGHKGKNRKKSYGQLYKRQLTEACKIKREKQNQQRYRITGFECPTPTRIIVLKHYY